MLNIRLICVGRIKEKYYADAAREYSKRLGAFCKLEVEELPESRLSERASDAQRETALLKEASAVENKIPKGAFVIALCVEGTQLTSEGLSRLIEQRAGLGCSKICMVVGGSEGLHERIKNRADLRLSMSEMTFPHHLARVILLEQIYRSFTIQEGGNYHK